MFSHGIPDLKSLVQEPLTLCEVDAHGDVVEYEEDGDGLPNYHINILKFDVRLLKYLVRNVGECRHAHHYNHDETEPDVNIAANSHHCNDAYD